MTSPSNQVVDYWIDDVLSRKPLSEFLYTLVLRRFEAAHAAPGSGALCFAIDADWGAGKSFFVDRWAKDVADHGHPIIRFDAWANDLADDPLLGFMSALEKSLRPFLASLPVSKVVRDRASKLLKQVLKQAPRAVLPALTVVGKGLVKKLAAVDVNELVEAVSEGATEIVADDLGVRELGGEALQKFFDSALKAHSEKRESIKELRRAMEGLLEYLVSTGGAKLPMFVFIDELDRCRPDYAVRLLEGVKHLFDAHGICFVFSTNLTQLGESAKAVYGPGFDGYRYLKRFFAFEYRLPAADSKAYARLLISKSPLRTAKFKVLTGCPDKDSVTKKPLTLEERLEWDLSLITEAFQLSLRSVEQVFSLAEAATAGLLEGAPVASLYLFFLAAAYFEGRDAFYSSNPKLGRIDDVFSDRRLPSVALQVLDREAREYRGHVVRLDTILKVYDQVSRQTVEELYVDTQRANTEYPLSLKNVIAYVYNGTQARSDEVVWTARHYDLVRMAGQIIV